MTLSGIVDDSVAMERVTQVDAGSLKALAAQPLNTIAMHQFSSNNSLASASNSRSDRRNLKLSMIHRDNIRDVSCRVKSQTSKKRRRSECAWKRLVVDDARIRIFARFRRNEPSHAANR